MMTNNVPEVVYRKPDAGFPPPEGILQSQLMSQRGHPDLVGRLRPQQLKCLFTDPDLVGRLRPQELKCLFTVHNPFVMI